MNKDTPPSKPYETRQKLTEAIGEFRRENLEEWKAHLGYQKEVYKKKKQPIGCFFILWRPQNKSVQP